MSKISDGCPVAAQEEGGPCPTGCGGTLGYPPVEGCSCHINTPCSACTDRLLTCDVCGWEEPEPEVQPVMPTPTDFYDKIQKDWGEAFRRGHTFAHGGRIFEVRHDGRSGSTHVIEGRYEGPVTANDIFDHFGDGTFGHRGPIIRSGRFRYTKITD